MSGCLTAFLMLVVGIGILVCAALAFIATVWHQSSDLPGSRAWDTYLTAAFVWGAFIGSVGLRQAFRSPGASASGAVTWLGWCGLGMVLAICWPVEVLILVCVVVPRLPNSVWTRAGALLISAVVAIVGPIWGFWSYDWQSLRPSGTVAPGEIVGTWQTASGGQIVFRPDGGFVATDLPKDMDIAGYWNSTGTWVLSHGARDDRVLVLRLGIEGPRLSLTVYKLSSTLVLRDWTGPDSPSTVFRRR